MRLNTNLVIATSLGLSLLQPLMVDGAVPNAVLYDTQPATGIGTTPPSGSLKAPLQTIDATATGTGAIDAATLAAMTDVFINANWFDAAGTKFVPVGTDSDVSRNYLAFTTPNVNNVKTAVRFGFTAGGVGDQYAGGFNDNGARIVGTAGNSIFMSAALGTTDGKMEITFGSYEGSGTDESTFTFLDGSAENQAYAVRAVGFIIVGAASGTSPTATFYGPDGSVLQTLSCTSPGELTGTENAGGGELFFGYDAGDDSTKWVSRIVISGDTGGNAGFDDFSFTPAKVIQVGTPTPSAVLYDTVSATGIASTPPAAPYTAPLQTIDATGTGTGAIDAATLAAMPNVFINTFWKDSAGTSFATVGTDFHKVRNYLAFTSDNVDGVKGAVKFDFNDGGGNDQYAGGYNDNGPRIVVDAGNSIFLSTALDSETGKLAITFGGYAGTGTTEQGFTFLDGPVDGTLGAVRAAGFVISGVADGSTVTANFYGVKGQLLGTVTATSPGETNGAENAAGGELFLGYDAGTSPGDWIHSISISGATGGNAGFDDFAFAPVSAVSPNAVGSTYGPFNVVDGYIDMPHVGPVYVMMAPWLYVSNWGTWIYAPENYFGDSGLWLFGAAK